MAVELQELTVNGERLFGLDGSGVCAEPIGIPRRIYISSLNHPIHGMLWEGRGPKWDREKVRFYMRDHVKKLVKELRKSTMQHIEANAYCIFEIEHTHNLRRCLKSGDSEGIDFHSWEGIIQFYRVAD